MGIDRRAFLGALAALTAAPFVPPAIVGALATKGEVLAPMSGYMVGDRLYVSYPPHMRREFTVTRVTSTAFEIG